MVEIEIVNVYTQDVPAMRFIGKRYGDEDRVDGGYGEQWHEWHQSGRVAALERYMEEEPGRQLAGVEDGNTWAGLMRWKEGEPFQYWIGRFAAAGTAIPEGYEAVDFPAGAVGICWLKGRTPEIFGKEMQCAERLKQEGYEVVTDGEQACWFFERYADRFMTADEDGRVIVDIGHFIRK